MADTLAMTNKTYEVIIDQRTGAITTRELTDHVIDVTTLLHECPECRAAIAAGEEPQIVSGSELAELLRHSPQPGESRQVRRARARRARRT